MVHKQSILWRIWTERRRENSSLGKLYIAGSQHLKEILFKSWREKYKSDLWDFNTTQCVQTSVVHPHRAY